MQVLEDNWLIWVPKIFRKVKVESQTHKKTYLPFLPVISECNEKSAEDVCERKPHVFIGYHIMIINTIHADPDVLVLFICLHKLLQSKMPKSHPEFLIILEVNSVFSVHVVST